MARDDVTKLAVPLARVAVPSTVAPSLNVTDPVGGPGGPAVLATTAVNVTACPNWLGLLFDATVVLVPPSGAAPTVSVSVAELLPGLGSPTLPGAITVAVLLSVPVADHETVAATV